MAETYTVNTQTPTTTRDAAGNYVPGIEVTFTTKPSGIVSSVIVPRSQYSADEVDKAIAQSVTVLEAVQKL